MRPIYIYGASREQFLMVREAKQLAVGHEFFVKPIVAEAGQEEPFLGFLWPEWCPFNGWADVRKANTPERLAKAVRQVLGLDEPVNMYGPDKWLEGILGPVTEGFGRGFEEQESPP